MNLSTALLISIMTGLLYMQRRMLGEMQLERPIVVGPLIGLILGDLNTGLMVGASLELIFIGAAPIGGAVPQNIVVASVLGTVTAILTGKGVAAALVVAVPAAVVATTFELFAKVICPVFVHRADKYAEEGDSKGISMMLTLGNLVHFFSYVIPIFIALYFGAGAIAGLTTAIPKTIMSGIQAVGNMLPALGFGLLLNSLGAKKLMPYFFIGFAIVAYVPAFGITGVAVIAIALAILLATRKTSSNS